MLIALCLASILTPEMKADLVDKAVEARKKAYAPYSNYFVGAAVLTKSGKVYSGCNVENASYGLSNCAERTAIFKAVSEGDLEIDAIAVVTRNGGAPCGACRQVINEFNPDILVIIADENKTVHSEHQLGDLLPSSFGPRNLR